MNKFDIAIGNDLNDIAKIIESKKKHQFKVVKITGHNDDEGNQIYGVADIISGDTAAMYLESALRLVSKMNDSDDWNGYSHSGGFEYEIVI